MHLVYIDEVKYHAPAQPYHWLCALAFPADSVQLADEALSFVAKATFGTSSLSQDTEFHAKDILHGKGAFKRRPIAERVETYCRLLDVISDTPDLGRIEIRLDVGRIASADYKDMAFVFLVEKVDDYMKAEKSIALLIADNDRELAGSNVRSLSHFRDLGTPYPFGRPIKHVVDTIHHTESHHSRLLQLADVYVYTLAMAMGDNSKYPRSVLIQYARDKGRILFPTKYKNWPPPK